MKRLTERSQFDGDVTSNAPTDAIIKRLAEYEETGATPEDIHNLILRVGDLENQLGEQKAPETRQEVLRAAEICVCGHRTTDYGTPEDNFGKIADLWTTYKGTEFSAIDVSVMMSLQKIARIAGGQGTIDCFIDLAGYASCGGEIYAKLKE